MTDSVPFNPTRLHLHDADAADLLRRSRVRAPIAAVVCLLFGGAGLAALVLIGQTPGMIIGVVAVVPTFVREVRPLKSPRHEKKARRGSAPTGTVLLSFAGMGLVSAGQYWVVGVAFGGLAAWVLSFAVFIPIARRELARNSVLVGDQGRLFEATLILRKSPRLA